MTTYSLQREAGSEVKLARTWGRVCRRLDEPFLPYGNGQGANVALPAWLTAQDGTASFHNPSSGTDAGYARLTTAAASGALATVMTTFTMNDAEFGAMAFTLEGLVFDNDASPDMGYSFLMGFSRIPQLDVGAYLYQRPTDELSNVQWHGGGGRLDQIYHFVLGPNGTSRSSRNLTILYVPSVTSLAQAELHVLEDDQVMASDTYPAATIAHSASTVAFAQLISEGAAHYFQFQRAVLELWSD